MGRRPRGVPWEQGFVKRIWKLLCAPSVDYKPDGRTMKQWLESTWDVASRDIRRFTPTQDFRMPGLLAEAPQRWVQGIGYRKIFGGEQFFVVFDERDPEHIFVEVIARHREQLFVLSPAEWYQIRPKLKEVPFTERHFPGKV